MLDFELYTARSSALVQSTARDVGDILGINQAPRVMFERGGESLEKKPLVSSDQTEEASVDDAWRLRDLAAAALPMVGI